MEKIQIPVTFDKANRKKDRSVSLSYTSNLEVSTPDFAVMDRLTGKEGWLLFSPNQFSDADIPTQEAPTEERKTKLQRLRAVHYLFWKDHTDQSEPFNNWWDRKFEQLLDKYKERLD